MAPCVEIESLLSDDKRSALIEKMASEGRAASAFSLLRRYGIEPVLVKGLASARYYPKDKPRSFIDTDLAVSPDDFKSALAIIRSGEAANLNIDLHNGFRHFDTRPWHKVFDATEIMEVAGGSVRVLSPEDNLRLICAHWLNDGAANRERLWDIYYAVANRTKSFDWGKALNGGGPERRTWVLCAIGLAHKYLGLNVDDLPFREQIGVPKWVTETVESEWKSGVRLRPLVSCLGEPRMLMTQIRKRFPPNPIQATIEMQRPIETRLRRSYQVRTMFRRVGPSIEKFKAGFKRR
ncbi:MAG TPA: nucleotidyltransferase family protein [Pyrinomonadaceae bacterium]|nr:nucleotidyltransferase family protein [Pyrinomonadaceae bacterium]